MATKLLVVGGSGFLGIRCCRSAVQRGFDVLSASRSGAPATRSVRWVDGGPRWEESVEWLATDAKDIPDEALQGCTGVVSTACR